ncbi:MAG: tetratricopeptide repeat protein [Gemmiger sp.]
MINYYVELGLDPSMDEAALEKALRDMKKKWTARTNAPDLEKRQKAERMIALLNEASRILCNKSDREDYDRKLNREKNKQTTPTVNTPDATPVMPTGTGTAALIALVESFYERGQYQQALEAASKALAAGVNDPSLYYTMAMCYAECNDYDRAYQTLNYAVVQSRDPDLKSMLIRLCLRLFNMKAQARQLLDEMMHDYPDTNVLVAYDAEYDLYMGNEATAEAKIADYRQAYPQDRDFLREMAESFTWYADTYITEHASGGEYIASQEDMDNYLKYCRRANELSPDPKIQEKLQKAEELNATTFNRDNLGGLVVSLIAAVGSIFTIVGPILFGAMFVFLLKFSFIPNWMILRTDYTESYDGPYKVAHILCMILWGWIKWSWKAAWGIVEFSFRLAFGW